MIAPSIHLQLLVLQDLKSNLHKCALICSNLLQVGIHRISYLIRYILVLLGTLAVSLTNE